MKFGNEKTLNFNYDTAQEKFSGCIWLSNGSWLERYEPKDWQPSWLQHSAPKIPKELINELDS